MQKTKYRLPLLGRDCIPAEDRIQAPTAGGRGTASQQKERVDWVTKKTKRNDIMYKKKSRLGNAEQGEGVRRGGWGNLNEGGRMERKSH